MPVINPILSFTLFLLPKEKDFVKKIIFHVSDSCKENVFPMSLKRKGRQKQEMRCLKEQRKGPPTCAGRALS